MRRPYTVVCHPEEKKIIPNQKKKKVENQKTRFPAPSNSSLPLHTGGYGGKTFGTFHAVHTLLHGSTYV